MMQAFFDCLDLLEGCNRLDRHSHIERLIRNSTTAEELAMQLNWLCGAPFSLRLKPAEIEAALTPDLDPDLLNISQHYTGDKLEALALMWQTAGAVPSNDPLISALAPLTPTQRYWLLRMVAGRAIPHITPRDAIYCLASAFESGADVIGRHWFTMDHTALIRSLQAQAELPPPSPLGFRMPHPVTDGLHKEGIEQANIQGVKVILSEGQAWTARGEPLAPFTQLPAGMAVEAIVQLAGRTPNSVIRKALTRKKGLDDLHRIIVTDILALRGKDVGARPTIDRLALLDQLTWPDGYAPITYFDIDPRHGAIIKGAEAAYGDSWSGWLRLPPQKKQAILAGLTWQMTGAGVKLSVGVGIDGGTAPIASVQITDQATIKAIKALPLAGKYGPVRELAPGALSVRVKASQLVPSPRKKAGYLLGGVELVDLTDEPPFSLEALHELFR